MIKKSREAIVAQNDGIKPGKDIIQTKNTTLSVKQSGLAGKLERRLQDPWEKAAGGDIQESIEMLKAKDVTLAANGQDVAVIVSLTTNSALQNVETLLKNKGATVVRAGKDTIKIAVPIANLDDIASMPEVRHVRAVHPPKPKNTTKTQGISLTRANAWHSAGRTGQNVKVAIVDMGFAHLSTLKAQDEIPAGAIEVNYTATSMTDGFSSHGSACAETVYDMAPGAQQYLIKIDDPTDLITVKDYCIANGIKIISCSLGWDNLNFHDGIAYANPYTTVADHPITAVDLAQANDILWCAAAGNEQTQHTLIDWRDGGPAPDSTLDWNSSYSSYNRLELNNSFTIPAGTWLNIYMTWNQWPVSNQDFDLELYRNTGSGWRRVLASDMEISGNRTQNGSSDSDPTEEIYYQTTVSAQYAVVVTGYGTTTTPKFILRYYGVDWPDYYGYNNQLTPAPGSLSIPGDAASAFTVGAVDYAIYTNGPIESYSSLGPNNRAYTGGSAVTKPDICGPDQTASVSYGANFGGTSASTPHIAGLAALIKSVNPGFTSTQIRSYIESNGFNLGTAGKDNTYGSGAALLPSNPEIDLLGNAVSIADGDITPSLTDHTDFGSALVTSGTVVRTFTITNSGTAVLTFSGSPRVAVNGPHSNDFTVTVQPAAAINVKGKTSFQVTFDPSAAGTRTAALSIANNDADENPYNYSIQGTGTVANIAPTNILLSSTQIAENQSIGTQVGHFTTQDPDAGNSFTYSLVSGTGSGDNSSFTISGSNLMTTALFNFEVKSNYTVRVQSADQGGLSTQKVFAIIVTDIDETPIFEKPTDPTNGNIILRWSSTSNKFYTIHYSTNLLTGFSVLQSNIPATPTINSSTQSLLSGPQQFWKITTDP